MREQKEANGVTARDGLKRMDDGDNQPGRKKDGRKDGRRRGRRRKGRKRRRRRVQGEKRSSGSFSAAVVGTGATQLGAVVHT